MTALQEAFLNKRIADLIWDDHNKKQYCPTAVCLVTRVNSYTKEPEFLLVHDRYGYDYCVQGRIGIGEHATDAVRRKVWDEAGIFNVNKIRFLFSQKTPYLPGRPRKDGFTVGKDYFMFSAELDGAQLRSFSSTTIVNCYWSTLPELAALCDSLEGPKAAILYRALETLGYSLPDEEISIFA